MFRFSIRELMLVTLVVALGVAWFVEHRHAQAALVLVKKSDDTRIEIETLWDSELTALEKELPKHGLDYYFSFDRGLVIYKPQILPEDDGNRTATSSAPSSQP